MDFQLEKRIWWNYLEKDLKGLFRESETLVGIFDGRKAGMDKFHDYAFLVFPASKAYEGFLKKLFLDLGFISKRDYLGNRFRIGRALNPSLGRKYRKESVYNKLTDYCGGAELATELWDTWRTCRNLLFHWFPKEKNSISFSEAINRLTKIFNAIDMAFTECNVLDKLPRAKSPRYSRPSGSTNLSTAPLHSRVKPPPVFAKFG